MANVFDQKINRLGQELLAIKRFKERQALTLRTLTQTLEFTFTLAIFAPTNPYSHSTQMATASFATGVEAPFITFEIVGAEELAGVNKRVVHINRTIDADGNLALVVFVIGSADDLSRLQSGETVTATVQVKINSTSTLEATTAYSDLYLYGDQL